MNDQVALLADLLQLLAEWLECGDGTLEGAVRHWLASQTLDPGTRVPPIVPASRPDQRRMLAIKLATEQGAITSGDLASALGVSGETARRDLVSLTRKGLLAVSGAKRGRTYVRR